MLLVINGGSTSLKIALFNDELIEKSAISFNQEDDPKQILAKLVQSYKQKPILTIVHRVVHGGKEITAPCVIDQSTKEIIRKYSPLAPLHNPLQLQWIDKAEELFPKATQIAVFDTAFHTTIPEHNRTYPLPQKWRDLGIEKFGFHGISHHDAYIRTLTLHPDLKDKKLITCHLGGGSSITGISNGKSQITSMGFTPLDGVIMSSRPGTLDPGIFPFLLKNLSLSPTELETALSEQSGLFALTGTTNFKKIVDSRKNDPHCALAYEMFVSSLTREIGATAAQLGGFDALLFTGGIGEHSPELRQSICQNLSFLGLDLDPSQNQTNAQTISTPNSPILCLVLEAKEEEAMCAIALPLLSKDHRKAI